MLVALVGIEGLVRGLECGDVTFEALSAWMVLDML